MLDLIKSLTALPGVSGDESQVAHFISQHALNCGAEVSSDHMGNILVFKKGAKTPVNKIMLCAHMDEVGLIITHISDDGFLKFAAVGGIDPRILPGKPLLIGQNNTFGVVGIKPIHLVPHDNRDKAPMLDDLYIDIGSNCRDDAQKLVTLGDTAVFCSDFVEFGDCCIKTRALDDRFGCAVLLKLIESNLPVDCHFAFTVQEEVGARGAAIAAYQLNPDIAIIIEGTTAADLPSVSDNNKVCKLGSGPVIPFMDSGTIYDKTLYRQLTALADEHEIPWQSKSRIAGGTDAQTIHRSRSGVRCAAIAAPIRYLHSPSCTANYSDLNAVLKLTQLFLVNQEVI